jgi:hypothetical protein
MNDLSQIGVGSLLSFTALVISVLIGIGTLYARFTGPSEKRWQVLMRWQRKADEKLQRDYQAINRLQNSWERRYKFEDLTLSSLEAIIDHLSTGNGNEKMKSVRGNILNFYKTERKQTGVVHDPLDDYGDENDD